MFSPYYAWSGRRDPLDHVAINCALFARGGAGRWAMTERGRGAVERSEDTLRVGPSAWWVDGRGVNVEIVERGWPVPRRVRGRVRLIPEVEVGRSVVLSAAGAHRWWPIAPRARVEVAFTEPEVSWSGVGYLDCNWGMEPLEDGFDHWTWSRAPWRDGAVVSYDVQPTRGAAATAMALRFGGDGRVEEVEPTPVTPLRSGWWGVERRARSEGGEARLVHTLTDSHFYVRSVVESRVCGERVVGVHESLSLRRFSRWWAKLMLPFRMPRRG